MGPADSRRPPLLTLSCAWTTRTLTVVRAERAQVIEWIGARMRGAMLAARAVRQSSNVFQLLLLCDGSPDSEPGTVELDRVHVYEMVD